MSSKNFKQWLRSQYLADSTAAGYVRIVGRFKKWLADEKIKPARLQYTDLLAYIRHLKSSGLSPRSINNYLTGVRWWLEFQKSSGEIPDNPAVDLQVKGARKRIPHDLLEEKKLQQLYSEYTPRWTEGWRNKAVLGLLVFQGLQTTELERLKLDHLDLEQGKIRIPEGKLGAGRTLDLQAPQILDLQRYQSEVRPQLLEQQPESTNKLLLSGGGSPTLHNAVKNLVRQLRKRYSWFTGAAQLRASRIAIWVKACNLREAQYRAGHRQVSTTERYKTSDLESLTEAINKHHPLGGDPRS